MIPYTTFTASQALTIATLQALQPALTTAPTSVVMSLINALLSADGDTNTAIIAQGQNVAYTTAAPGAPLQAKAADRNVVPSAGLSATCAVVFFLQVPATETLTFAAGTVVSTGGDGTTTPQITFLTQTTATISSGATDSGTPVLATCTSPGSLGNVGAGTVTTLGIGGSLGAFVSNALTVGWPGNNQVSNPNGAGVGGVDADTPGQIREKIAIATTNPVGVANMEAALLSVSGIYDAYVLDPLAGSGIVYYYWCEVDGTTPGINGGTSTASGTPDNTTFIAGVTLTGTAAQADAAIRARAPAGLQIKLGTTVSASSPASTMFTVVSVTALSLTYTAPATVQASVIDPLLSAGVSAYFNGGTVNGVTTPGLFHNEVPSIFGLTIYLQQVVGGSLINCTISAVTPSTTFTVSPVPTTVFRASASISVTVTP